MRRKLISWLLSIFMVIGMLATVPLTVLADTSPSATSVTVSGDTYPGSTLTGSYTYNAGTGGASESGTAFRWLRTGDAYVVDSLSNFNASVVSDNPGTPTAITLAGERFISSLVTYHLNSGVGAAPGTIALRDSSGIIYGPYAATAYNNNTYWTAKVNVLIPAGTYTVIDSDNATWSYNATSGNAGFVRVYAMDFSAVSGATASTYAVTDSDLGKYLAFEVTVKDSSGTVGVPVMSVSSGIVLPNPSSGLVACYSFNGTANDISGNGNNATIYGPVLTNDRFGNANSAYLFSGTNNYIYVESPVGLPNGNSPRTIAAWINCYGDTAGDKYQSIAGYGSALNGQSFSLERGGNSGSENDKKLFVLGWNNDYRGTTTLADNQWKHVAVTFDGTNTKLYVDGVLDGTNPKVYNTVLNAEGLRIGFMISNDGWHSYFNGAIDDVYIYNRALTQNEITALANVVSPTVVSITAVSGVTAPARGGTPVSAITETAQYTGSVSWSPAHSTFAASTAYTATITLTPKTGYTLTGVAANSFTVTGASSVSNSADSGVITAVFPATAAAPDTIISLTTVSGVTAPARGGTPVSAITETAQYTGSVSWSPAHSTFAASTAYTATITLTPKTGYTLTGVAANSFTVTGASSVSNSADSGVITAVFPATAAAPDTIISLTAVSGVTAPARGGTPVSAITETAQYTGSVSWSPAHSTFAASTAYTATITLTPKTGYTLTGVAANSFTVTGASSVSNSADSGVITAVFPATAAAPDNYDGGISFVTAPETIYNAEVKEGAARTEILRITVNKTLGTGTASLSTATAAALFKENADSAVVMPTITGVSAYTLELPMSSLSGNQENGALTLSTSVGSVTIPENMLSTISGTGKKTADITIASGYKTGLSDEAKADIGSRPVIQLSLSMDGVLTEWSNSGAPVRVSIPYTPTAKELDNPESIIIWYLDGGGNPVCIPNGHYDPITGTVTFTTTHFSNYAVGYNKESFFDVADTAWYGGAVSFIAARGITKGCGNGNFDPYAKLTRGQFIVMLLKAYGISADANPNDNFSDAGNTYYTNYLAAAKRLGISNGVGGNVFAPEQGITRQEMFTLLYNALKTMNALPEGTSGKTLSDFTDYGNVSSWAKDALTLFVGKGTITGSGGNLNPTSIATRAEMAQVMYSLLGK